MDTNRLRRAVAAVSLGGAVWATSAGAFTMGEQMATTGIQNTLAATSAPSAAGTIGSVKKSVTASTQRANAGLPGADGGGPVGGGATSGAPRASASSHSGWGGATQGWAKQGAASGPSGGGWSGPSGGWAASSGWPTAGKAWSSGQSGSGWARPGGTS